jgi:hypothetical protein
MDFIGLYWSEGHILSVHRDLMEWQHNSHQNPNQCNWVIAKGNEGIEGILGFIPSSRYDEKIGDENFTWLALWKVRNLPKNNLLGLRLLYFLLKMPGVKNVGVSGINPYHTSLYKALDFKVGELNQHYLCNPHKTSALISNPNNLNLPIPSPGVAIFKELNAKKVRCMKLKDNSSNVEPLKTTKYFSSRYFNHPVYQYGVFDIRMNGISHGLLALRIAVAGSSKVLRVVDFIGDEEILSECGTAFSNLLKQYDCEYVDFWEFGLSPQVLCKCGFQKVSQEGSVIVPNYFEPFSQKTSPIQIAVKLVRPESNIRIFRADGDQDRPNSMIIQ